ncbi:MAG: hypothetical protein S0880_27845 [Actinomycetota bacterium]|nr:hypothetical protein [Actinomycetota bacterium]
MTRARTAVGVLALLVAGCTDLSPSVEPSGDGGDGGGGDTTVRGDNPVLTPVDPGEAEVLAPSELCVVGEDSDVLACETSDIGPELVGWRLWDDVAGVRRFEVFRNAGTGGMQMYLVARDPEGDWTDVKVNQAEVTGDDADELLVGFRTSDGDILQLDIVDFGHGQLTHRELEGGAARAVRDGIETWSGRYVGSDELCCPSEFDYEFLQYDDSDNVESWFIADSGVVSARQVPDTEL